MARDVAARLVRKQRQARTSIWNGPIIAQATVAVLATATPETLAARVLEAEHRLYPTAVALVASGRARVVDEQVIIDQAPTLP